MFQLSYDYKNNIRKMIGECSFEDEIRAPKATYTFEQFYLLQKINSLRLFISGEKVELSLDQKQKKYRICI